MNSVRRENPGNGILWSEIQLDGKGTPGTGEFVAQVESSALGDRPLIATVSPAGTVNIGFGIRARQREIVVLVGDNLQSSRQFRKAYQLPETLGDGKDGHEIKINFQKWKIQKVQLDGMSLREAPDGKA